MILCKPVIASTAVGEAKTTMNQVKLASSKAIKVFGDLTTPSSESNKASPKLVLASGEATSAVPGHQAILYEIGHNWAKAKAHLSGEATLQAFHKAKALSGEAKIASSSKANASHMSDEAISQVYYKAKALSGGAKIASSGEVNASHTSSEAISQAFYKAKALSKGAKIASSGEANVCGEAKLASSKAKQAAFIK